MNTEIYTYSRKEIQENRAVMAEKKVGSIIYLTENVIGNIYLPNSSIIVGSLSYINNLVLSKDNSFNTSIGTIITNDGSLVYNLNYVIKFGDSKPDIDSVFVTRPTFTSGKYLTYKNLTITIQILQLTGERIIAIEYDNI